MGEILKPAIVAVIGIIVIELIWRVSPISVLNLKPHRSIKEIATRDLLVMGHYDNYLTTSVTQRMVAIWKRLLIHTQMPSEDIAAGMTAWLSKCYDPDRLIESVIHKVNADFIAMCDNERPAFTDENLPKKLPYAPKTLLYNDYVDVSSLDEWYYACIDMEV